MPNQNAWPQGKLQRVRNILANPRVATTGDAYTTEITLLHAKYPQYEHMPLGGRPLIVIEPARIPSWRASDAALPSHNVGAHPSS